MSKDIIGFSSTVIFGSLFLVEILAGKCIQYVHSKEKSNIFRYKT